MAFETTNVHRVYIQSLLSRRIVSDKVALELYTKAIEACKAHDSSLRGPYRADGRGIEAFMGDLSTLLSPVHLEVTRAVDSKGKVFFVLRNVDSSEVASSATDLSAIELEYYRLLIDAIMESYPANSVTHGQARSLISSLSNSTKMTKSGAEALLEALCSRQWIQKSKRSRYSLSVRAAAELEQYLKTGYEDLLHNCIRCKRLVFEGVRCATDDCETHIHNYCLPAILQAAGASCPHCKVLFSDNKPTPVGEKAVSSQQDGFEGGLNKRKRKSNEAARDAEELEEEEEDDEGEFEEEDASQSQSQPNKRNFVPGTQYDDDDDDDDEEDQPSSSTHPRRH